MGIWISIPESQERRLFTMLKAAGKYDLLVRANRFRYTEPRTQEQEGTYETDLSKYPQA